VTDRAEIVIIGRRAAPCNGMFDGFDDHTATARPGVNLDFKGVGEIMIGPPGLPKYGRRVFSFAVPRQSRSRQHQNGWKWITGLYLAGVLAHFSHHMIALPDGSNAPSEALTSAPLSLVWPADLMKTLITLG
jgi:hypothetical protein